MKNILLLIIVLFSITHTKSQCPAGTLDNTGFFPTFVTPTNPGITNENTAHAAWGGDYYLFNVISGNTYYFRSCFPENSSINTVLSLYNSSGTTLLAFNDDFCGQQSQISWLATFTGQVRLSYYQSGCTTTTIDTKLGIYYTAPCTAPAVTGQPSSTTVCNNFNTTFSVVATGSAPLTYQWQVSTGSGFNNISNGGVYTNATTATLNITAATAFMNTYQYRCIVTNSCGTATSNAASLTVNATNNWTGAVNSDWFIPGNWSCGAVPSANDDVVVSSGNPVIATGGIARCRNLTKSGFLSNINLNGATLEIFGNLNYTGGSFSTNSGSSFQFRGSTLQTATGGSPLTITNLVINNPNGLLLNKNIIVSGTCSLVAGNIFTNNFILFASSISGVSNSRFVVTGDASNNVATSGGLRTTILPGASFVFPIGPIASSYNPCTIQNTNGPSEDFLVRVNTNAIPGPSPAQTVQRTWQIDETTPGGNTGALTLHWNEADEGASFLRSLCGVFKSDGVAIDYSGYTPQNGAATFVSGTSWQKQLSGVTAFSPWGVTSAPSVLPLVLSNFNLQLNNEKKVVLHWQLAQGSTPQYFELFKSNNGIDFSLFKNINATSQLSYNSIDDSPYDGTNYYKLKLVSTSGEVKYSNILKMNLHKTPTMEALVFGNPVRETLKLQIDLPEKNNVVVQLLSMDGKQVFQKRYNLYKGSNSIAIQVENLAKGKYQMVIGNSNGEKLTHTIIKQ